MVAQTSSSSASDRCISDGVFVRERETERERQRETDRERQKERERKISLNNDGLTSSKRASKKVVKVKMKKGERKKDTELKK